MRLTESIKPNSVKIIELYNKIISDVLILRPPFQRKLVWKKQHKYNFIETILMNFPFPEIYLASSNIDIEKLTAQEIVVDGQQRLSTIVDYIQGEGDFENQRRVPPFSTLGVEQKKEFLNYQVTVKDLKDIDESYIKEIFRRINSTEFSLNNMERKNAEYGEGEFMLFCKQLANNITVSEEETDVIIEEEVRKRIYNFFNDNKIFTDNDTARMFDLQYIMIIVATIMEKEYFGRTTKIEGYMERYNESFEKYEDILSLLDRSVSFISSLKLESTSYWLNQANLFPLIIEISKLDDEALRKVDKNRFETLLLELEDKVGIYFNPTNEEDKDLITPDEQKFFEVSRQGSNEKASRDHRGKVVADLIKSSIIEEARLEERDLNLNDLNHAILIPTKTGLNKHIMDAISPVRDFFRKNGIYNYATEENGSKKDIKGSFIIADKGVKETDISLYKSKTRGDERIWIKDLPNYAEPGDNIALIYQEGNLYIINLNKYSLNDLREIIR